MFRKPPQPSIRDVLAGISVAMVAIPQSLAYAELAGLPAEYGLAAAALPAIAAAFFVSSRHLQTGPVALTALLTFGALSTTAEPFSSAYISQAALLALLVGVVRVLFGVLQLGRVAYLLSEPVLLGFTTAAAILIVSSQIPRALDFDTGDSSVLVGAFTALTSPSGWNWAALAFAIAVAAVMIAGRRVHDLFPSVLIAMVGALVASRAAGYAGTVIGELSGDFVGLSLALPWQTTFDLLPAAAAIALIGFAEPASIARTFAAQDRTRWSANQEFISQGVANLVAGISGGFPVGGSFSRSSLSRMAGATSAWAGAITGIVVLAAMPATPVLERLPQAVLGAIVIVAVIKLVRLNDVVTMMRQSGAQALVASGTIVATLLTAPRVERGVAIGIALAFIVHLFRELSVTTIVNINDDVLTITPQGVLWFATVPGVDARLRAALAEHPHITALEIEMSAVGRLDYSGAAALARLAEESQANGLDVSFCNVPPGCQRAAGIHFVTTTAPASCTNNRKLVKSDVQRAR